ncbi:hypothetical protein M406DRAFT_75227 [Cryphonectria parasitica EP155]|uniref:CENP-V/GFA domain-containing protein n=1 Tax=Cryphonectria parasitica (strain ATCC 38755 / EP155) TaxID=660469 RepID=A0A9P4XZ36_CRYP1|nr:uncharacterized protein M406DRAFT_75227 [Cryphonectria parasitica EP155]KAF3764002.1 hypothetical protein M406DRAFT_75227 [Cryphonectria parasitica EP155]
MPSGDCLCGKIGFEHFVEPAVTALCYCLDCQRWGGGGYSSNVAVSTTDFKITKGVPKKFVRKGGSGLNHPHFFCGDCGTSLYSQPEAMAGTTLTKAGSLNDDASDISIKVEFFTKDRRNYGVPVQGARQLKTMN